MELELAARAAQVRTLGARLAVDDAGAGFASFRHILRLGPEYIKLDRTLIENIAADPARRALAAAVVLFAFEVGSAVVAEGVETVAELRMAQTLGIDAAQASCSAGRPKTGPPGGRGTATAGCTGSRPLQASEP